VEAGQTPHVGGVMASVSSWFEKRRQRRRRRERMEEIIAWFVVPVIVIGLIWAGMFAYDIIKGTPIMTIISGSDRERAAP
jgi:hypothetical protein